MYCTTAEVLGKIRDDMIDAILGSDLIEDEQERTEKITACTEEAISDACAEIDGWVSKRYKVPFLEPVPPIVSKLAKDIAVYNLASRTGIDEDDRRFRQSCRLGRLSSSSCIQESQRCCR